MSRRELRSDVVILNRVDPSNPDGAHQPRERAVPCQVCLRATWNWNGLCDKDQEKAA